MKILRLLTCSLLILSSSASLLQADRVADLQNESTPPGAVMTPPWHKYTGFVPATGGPTGYTPAQMRHAYGLDQLDTTGQGQLIAIVDAYGSPTMQADLDTFCATLGIPSTTIQVYYPQGQPVANSGWATETSLDVEWAHAIAPGATIVLVASQSNSDADLFAAVDYAVNLGATQVSMSWGGPEFSTEMSSDFHFNVPGVTFFVSSGDNGAGVSYPSSSPYVVAVGGTTLNLDSSGNITSETGWSGSGGGPSVYETAPSYQAGWWNGTMRGVPDVAYDADPATGVPVYMTGPGWQQVGGTSMSAPQWAALSALANSLRQQSVNSAPGVCYSLATANYAAYYHDIISGSNGAYSAGPGYDLVTGLGTPVANNLVIALAGGFSSQVAAPVFFPPPGNYSSAQNVKIVSATPGASIRYTTDGSIPTETNGTLYSGPVTIGSNTTFKAIAYESGLTDSPVTGGAYTFLPSAAAPTFSPPSGTYTTEQTVMITSATSGVFIRYTTDGSTPTETNGTLYSGQATIVASATLSAIAYGNGYGDSSVASAAYTINLPPCPTAPTFSPVPGTYANAQSVTLTSTISGASFLYTTDGSTPTQTNGTLYSGPVSIGSTTVLKAAAYKTGVYSIGPVSGGIYTITSSPAVALNVLYEGFALANNGGINPTGGLAQGSDGSFYGTTQFGGNSSGAGYGTIFKLTPAGVFTSLHAFNGTDGASPWSSPILGTDGNFYSTASGEWTNSNHGTVFKLTPAGTLTTLATFTGANGAGDFAGLVRGSDGNFYGTTMGGGSSNLGTVFKMTPAGVLTTLVSFDGTNSQSPMAGLVQGSDGNFYGATMGASVQGDLAGGGNVYGIPSQGDLGTIFKVTPAGVLTTLVWFNGTNGQAPEAALVQGGDGNFYGTTYIGGANYNPANNFFGIGTIFKVTPAGVLTTLVAFNGPNGNAPHTDLIRASDGNIYGATVFGGSNEKGTIFRISPAGIVTTLFSFNGANGDFPYGRLLQGSDGNLYGTTNTGGIADNGTVFQLILPPQLAAPTFSPPAGTYTSAQMVTITSPTSGATIVYTTDGSMPSEVNGTIYSGPLAIGSATTLQAFAYKAGFTDSRITSGNYAISVTISSTNGFSNTPLSPPQSGTFTATFDASPSLSPINAVIALSKGAQTAYTGLACIARFNTAGDIDAYNGTAYQAASVIPYAKNTTYHFRMVVNVPANTYSVYVTPPGGSELTVGLNYKFRTAVTSLDTWTIDVNATPGGSVTVSNRSVSGSGGTVAAPTFSPGAGTYTTAQTVIINDSTSGASIRYTTDGSTPSETAGTLYTGSISISITTTLKAMAFKSGMTDSTVTTGIYTISTVTRSLTGTSSDGWHNLPIVPPQTGTFTATFDATPTVSPENAVVGLSKGVATAYASISCIARFNTSGQIDAYNGTAYQAASTISYAKNIAYHFRLVVNVPAHTYSVYVTPAGGTELTVGLNYAFRSTAVVSSLDTWDLDVNATPSGCSLTANNLNP